LQASGDLSFVSFLCVEGKEKNMAVCHSFLLIEKNQKIKTAYKYGQPA
jgi:hypothetical protein